MKLRNKPRIVLVQSERDGRRWWHVDVANKRCDCPNFLYRLQGTGRKCKHLKRALHKSL